MPDDLPPEIDVVTTPRGERYDLPAKNVGCVKIVAVPLMLIGLAFCFAGLYTSLVEGGVLGLIAGNSPGGKPFDPFNAVFGVPFFFIGLGTIYLGGMLAGGHSIIELRDDRLIATQRSGPFRWRRKVRFDQIKKFQVKSSNMDEATIAIGAALSALNVVLPAGKIYNLAWGYPKPILRALADRLSQRCEETKGARLVGNADVGIEVEERVMGQDREEVDDQNKAEEEFAQQPADSTVILEHNDVGLTITVPPVGVRKGAKGGLGIAVLWNGFMAITTGIGFSVGRYSPSDLLVICTILSLCWAVGIGLLIAAINAGKRKAILDVVGDTLLITRQSIFKTRQQEIPRDNIASIRRDKSGTEINNVPVMNLQVHLHEGKKISMFSQLSDDELGWIAAVLREALDVPSR